ncbi:RHS repeat protein [Rhodohalobacter mucosus]|uniref:RHS repeat protein n=1 Tax=Rhodohalobacter mucosus TaxID=2079485 RepID=UPI001304D774|nr:RHS repeat protein [Rhodohalobacter mucosus]
MTTYDYDSRGLLTERVSTDSGTSLYSYDSAGNLRFSQDANQAGSNVASYTGYDFANRPTVEGVTDIGATTFAINYAKASLIKKASECRHSLVFL